MANQRIELRAFDLLYSVRVESLSPAGEELIETFGQLASSVLRFGQTVYMRWNY